MCGRVFFQGFFFSQLPPPLTPLSQILQKSDAQEIRQVKSDADISNPLFSSPSHFSGILLFLPFSRWISPLQPLPLPLWFDRTQRVLSLRMRSPFLNPFPSSHSVRSLPSQVKFSLRILSERCFPNGSNHSSFLFSSFVSFSAPIAFSLFRGPLRPP